MLVEAHLHWVRYFRSYCEFAVGAVLLLATFLSPLGLCGVFFFFMGLVHWLQASCTQMLVTNRRVICNTGILSIDTEELKNNKVESAEIRQSLSGRLFGYATISFSGTGTSGVIFADVANPWEAKKAIDLALGESPRPMS